jgi:hypothetical protein
LAGGGYFGAWLPPTATVGQAQTTLRRLSLDRLGLMLRDRLVQEHNLGATQDIDIQGVYDDIALERDSVSVEFGDTQPVGTL